MAERYEGQNPPQLKCKLICVVDDRGVRFENWIVKGCFVCLWCGEGFIVTIETGGGF